MLDMRHTNFSFILPAEGNSITDNDIQKGYLRITVDFKKFFPNESCLVNVKINDATRSVNFRCRGRRSHLLHIGHEGMHSLSLQPGDSVRVKYCENRYELERI